MGEGILELKRRVYQLTGEFGDAFTAAAVALNTPPVTGRTLELVRECEAIGEVYEAVLDSLAAASRREGDVEEASRMESLRTTRPPGECRPRPASR